MYTREDILNYHCPRWDEWPDLGLYMDQVTNLLEKNVSIFYEDQSKIVTSTMINNYVKLKIIMPSKNKKYQREHLAYFYVVFLLKSVLGLSDICDAIEFLLNSHSLEKTYNILCDEIEVALKIAFDDNDKSKIEIKNDDDFEGIEIVRSVSLAFAYTLLTRLYIGAQKATQEVSENVEEKEERERKDSRERKEERDRRDDRERKDDHDRKEKRDREKNS